MGRKQRVPPGTLGWWFIACSYTSRNGLPGVSTCRRVDGQSLSGDGHIVGGDEDAIDEVLFKYILDGTK